jgi:hypothetical protein
MDYAAVLHIFKDPMQEKVFSRYPRNMPAVRQVEFIYSLGLEWLRPMPSRVNHGVSQ